MFWKRKKDRDLEALDIRINELDDKLYHLEACGDQQVRRIIHEFMGEVNEYMRVNNERLRNEIALAIRMFAEPVKKISASRKGSRSGRSFGSRKSKRRKQHAVRRKN